MRAMHRNLFRTPARRAATVALVALTALTAAGGGAASAASFAADTPTSSAPAWGKHGAGINADIDFETVTIAELRDMLDTGALTSVRLARAYVKRIKAVNTTGPSLRAIQSIDPTWREQAVAADKRRARGQSSGPLDGIPVILKDNIDVAGTPTTAGSLALAGNVAQSDATVTMKLRDAGAVILGKATMVEFAFWNGAGSWGYSSLGGQPLNPYDASYETSGSSSGPGIAAAAGLAAITIGTDTGGSVVTPAERMSLIGYRPTTGMVSRTGIVPITTFADTAGVMGRTVADVAIGASAIAGVDPADSATAASADHQPGDYTAALSATSLSGTRIGVVTPPDLTADQQVLWDASTAALQARGATAVSIDMTMTSFPFTATTYEFRQNLDNYLATRTAVDFPIKSVPELADFYRANPQDTQKYGAATLFGAEAVDLEADRAAHDTDLVTAQTTARANVDGLVSSLDLDAFVFAQTSTVQFEASIGSYPEVAVPAGYQATDRHPFSIVFMGKQWDDANLLSYAYDYEQATQLRQTPTEINPTMWRCAGLNRHDDRSLCLP